MDKKLPSLATHVVKATGAVEINEPSGTLTLADRRLFNFLLAHSYRGLCNGEKKHVMALTDVRQFAAEARGGQADVDNRRIKESIRKLQRVLVEFNYLDSERGVVWESSPLLSTCSIADRTGNLTYQFPEAVAERLVEPALYSYISLRVMYQFESKYALILYEILKRYADRNSAEPYWAVKTSELRDVLGCRDKLKDWKDFRRRALDPALEEIAALTEFFIDVHEARQGGGRGGGRVVGLTFHIRRKDRAEAEQAVRSLDKPRLQRRGEKRVREEEILVGRALAWMEAADFSTRLAWSQRAEQLDVKLPASAAARENLAQWVPAVARLICEEQKL